MNPDNVNIEENWKNELRTEFEKDYFDQIKMHLIKEKSQNKIIYPPGPLIFNAFKLTPFDKVKVVILGQDPYHGPKEAMGLCFSVPREIRIPPSLRNIFKELNRDLGIKIPNHGDLTAWTKQGVFLLNAILTVTHKSPGAHKDIGWQQFTDHVIATLSDKRSGIIFLLWGRYAQSKIPLINTSKHHVLTAAHPSPLARNAFMNCGHFSKTNQLLSQMGEDPIDWNLS